MKRLYPLFMMCLLLLGTALPAAAQDQDDEGLNDVTLAGQSRFTVLILGMDRRPSESDSTLIRTDVMILASIDLERESIGLLHLPRDLHMSPPGQDRFSRINTLLQAGENLQDGYGPYWVMDTLEYNLGMYVDRYVLFDFQAFRTVIDAMGGVEITTQYPIYDETFPDMNFGYSPFILPAGTHTLDGSQALRFVRTRHGDNDVVRGERQMQLMQAVHDKLREGRTLVNLLARAPELQQQLSDNLQTDLTLGDIAFLARYAALISSDNIVTGSLDDDYQMEVAKSGGQRVDVPDTSTIAQLMTDVFGQSYNN